MGLAYNIATLLYCFNEQDEILLLHRQREPNRGLWSPCGGKLAMAEGESPYVCGCREAKEEIGVELGVTDLHLTGIVSEAGFLGKAHWLMFLFEVTRKLQALPAPHEEGQFGFFSREELQTLALPKTDKEQLWPLFWRHRRGFFAAHCRSRMGGQDEWTIEDSRRV